MGGSCVSVYSGYTISWVAPRSLTGYLQWNSARNEKVDQSVHLAAFVARLALPSGEASLRWSSLVGVGLMGRPLPSTPPKYPALVCWPPDLPTVGLDSLAWHPCLHICVRRG